MRIKWFLFTVVINIFLLLGSSIILEYNSLTTRIQALENNIATALDTAVDTSMASEEFFGDNYMERFYSYAETTRGNQLLSNPNSVDPSLSYSAITLYRNGSWITGNTYVLSKFYEDYKRFPASQAEITNFTESFANNQMGSGIENSRAAIYSWLFGKVGQYYTADELKTWSSTNQYTLKQYGETNIDTEVIGDYSDSLKMSLDKALTPTPKLLEFYTQVGKQMRSKSPLKEKVPMGDGRYTFNVVNKMYPTLWNMGLSFSQYDDALPDGCVDVSQSASSNIMSDNWCATYHVGKIATTKEGTNDANKVKSIYMLTPFSLGVTYVPTEVTKPLFLANLENIVRLSKARGDSLTGSNKTKGWSNIIASADGCIDTQVHPNGNDEYVPHGLNSGDYVVKTENGGYGVRYINDGQIEYDMESAKIKVDYFYLDFADPANDEIVNRCLGAVPYKGGNYDSYKATAKIAESDSARKYYEKRRDHLGTGVDVDANYETCRIVAKITVRLRVQIPYQSPFMQWSRYLINTKGISSLGIEMPANEHFGIRSLTKDNGNLEIDEATDGLWYEYTTYRSISR